jgi:hypothetical protein
MIQQGGAALSEGRAGHRAPESLRRVRSAAGAAAASLIKIAADWAFRGVMSRGATGARGAAELGLDKRLRLAAN